MADLVGAPGFFNYIFLILDMLLVLTSFHGQLTTLYWAKLITIVTLITSEFQVCLDRNATF